MIRSLTLLLVTAAVSLAGSPAEAIAAAHADVQRFEVGERKYLRYLYLGQCEEYGPDSKLNRNGKAKQQLWQVLSAHVNGTSLKRRIYPLTVVVADEKGALTERDGLTLAVQDWDRAVLARVNLEYTGWKAETWELLAKVDPYFRLQQPDLTGKLSEVDGKGNVKPLDVKPAVQSDVKVLAERGGTLVELSLSETRPGEKLYTRVPGTNRLAEFIGNRPAKVEPAPAVEKQTQRKDALRAPWLDQALEAELVVWTGSTVPVVMADWFYWQTGVQAEREPGPGYYDLLGIKNEGDFQRRGGFDSKLFRDQFEEFVREYREAVRHSGVARQPRRVAAVKTLGGWGYVTFDSKRAIGNRNPLDTPDDRFDFEATEQLFHGANGILIQGLFAKGGKDANRQDTAPDFVGPDKTSTDNDGRIHAGQCFRCHSEGLKAVRGYYKSLYRGKVSIAGPDGKAVYKLADEYFERIEDAIEQGRLIHEQAIKRACGLTLKAYSEAIAEQWSLYAGTNPISDTKGFTLRRVAARIGCTPEKLQAAVRGLKARQPGKQTPLQGLRIYDVFLLDEKDQEPIPVDQYHEIHGELATVVMGAK